MKFSTQFFSYSDLPFFSNIVKDYLTDADAVRSLRAYASKEDIMYVIKERNRFPFFRKEIRDILSAQYAIEGVACHPTVCDNIDSLQQDNTYTVCTAHQPHIAFGPLYILYKAVHTLTMTSYLSKQYPSQRFVPVFFVGSEDADKGELLQLSIMLKKQRYHTAERGAIGRMRSERVNDFLSSIYSLVQHLPHAGAALQIVEEAYQLPTLSLAFRHILHCLFGEKGLVVLDVDDIAVKRLALPLLQKDVHEEFSSSLVGETTAYIDKHYGWHQLDSSGTNLFLIGKNVRQKISKVGDSFKMPDIERLYNAKEFADYIEQQPEKISPGAALRPMLQELILPNIMTIGGGAEIAYWLQLKRAFKEANIHFPLLQLRQSYQFVHPNDAFVLQQHTIPPFSLLEYYPFPIDKISKGEQHLQALLKHKQTLTESMEVYSKELTSLGYIHHTQLGAAQKSMTSTINKIERKFLQSIRKGEGIPALYNVFERLFPSGGLQERTDSFFEWYACYGEEWVSQLYQCTSNPRDNMFALSVLAQDN